MLTLVPDSDFLSTRRSARSLLVGMATLAGGVFLYLHWRITANDTSGWLALVLAVAAVPGSALGAFSLTHPDEVAGQTAGCSSSGGDPARADRDRAASRWSRFRGDPLAVGLVVGLAIASVRQLRPGARSRRSGRLPASDLLSTAVVVGPGWRPWPSR